jgi:hypothetical protein
MQIVGTIHFGLAWLVVICALAFSWNATGRRVMNVVLGIQVLCGLVFAGTFGMSHVPLPSGVWIHLTGGIVALALYGVTRRMSAPVALALSIAGLLCILGTFYLGMHMAGQA